MASVKGISRVLEEHMWSIKDLKRRRSDQRNEIINGLQESYADFEKLIIKKKKNCVFLGGGISRDALPLDEHG